jgi:Holliday junction resolvase RusA-like endonuclease
MNVTIELPLEPPRATAQGKRFNRQTGAVFHTPEYRQAEEEYAFFLKRAYVDLVKKHPLPFSGPVSCCITFNFMTRRRKDDGKPKETRPDLDNMVKCLLDQLTKVGYWYDDAQVTFLLVEKKWKLGEGSVEIEINDYAPEDTP